MKKIILITLIAILIIAIYNIFTSILTSYNNFQTAELLKNRLATEKTKNAFLKEKLQYVQTDEFINTQARNQLGLVKSDEYIVLAPPPDKKSTNAPKTNIPNWKKWMEVLF